MLVQHQTEVVRNIERNPNALMISYFLIISTPRTSATFYLKMWLVIAPVCTGASVVLGY